VTAVGDPSAGGVHPRHTSTPKPSTAFGHFKQAVSTTRQPDGRVCCPRYAAQTDSAMEKETQRETTYIVIVITYARTEVKYKWNVRKGRHSMPSWEYATILKTLIVMVLYIMKTGGVKSRGNPLKLIVAHMSYADEERTKLTGVKQINTSMS
jgi:hypothetical protein